jgi:hypothetical protein
LGHKHFFIALPKTIHPITVPSPKAEVERNVQEKKINLLTWQQKKDFQVQRKKYVKMEN